MNESKDEAKKTDVPIEQLGGGSFLSCAACLLHLIVKSRKNLHKYRRHMTNIVVVLNVNYIPFVRIV